MPTLCISVISLIEVVWAMVFREISALYGVEKGDNMHCLPVIIP